STKPGAHSKHKKHPRPIRKIRPPPPPPLFWATQKWDFFLVVERGETPPISDLAQPMLRLAGIRINPATNGRHHPPRMTGLHLIRVQDGKEQSIQLPQNAYIGSPEWSPDGRHFSFTNTTSNGIELWGGDATTAKAYPVHELRVNAILSGSVQWMPDGHTLLVEAVPPSRGKLPADSVIPDGPIIQESDGKRAPAATYEDLLQNPRDEDLFDY